MGAIQFSALKVIRSILKRRVAVSVQASQDKQNNSVKHSQTVSLPCNTHALIIHEGKTKEISAMTEVVYVIQNPPDLHKLFVRFSQPKSFNIFRIFDEYERLHAFGSHAIYNIRVHVVNST